MMPSETMRQWHRFHTQHFCTDPPAIIVLYLYFPTEESDLEVKKGMQWLQYLESMPAGSDFLTAPFARWLLY